MRVLTILARFGTERYSLAEAEVDALFERQMPRIDRTVVVVDNALPREFVEKTARRSVIGGDNSAGEFSAFDRALAWLGRDVRAYDFIHFATSAFNTLYVSYLQLFEPRLLEALAGRPVCLGHVDCYNEAVDVLTFRSRHWVRSCFFFLSPADALALGSFVSIHDPTRFFSGSAGAPFRADAPLSQTYRDYLTNWLMGRDIGQGVEWHSSFVLTRETLPEFERKALGIMNEQLLGARLRAMGCRTIDVTWAATMLAKRSGPALDLATPWQDQLANRSRDALVFAGCGS